MIRPAQALRAVLPALLLCIACSAAAPIASPQVSLRLIAFNDFHGHLETPPMGLMLPSGRIAAGGAAHLATAIKALREGSANSTVVAAGDLVSASPVISSLARDEPTVEALGEAGLELSSVGNHEFDHGRAELLRLQSIARYQWLAANVIDSATGKPLLPAYAIRDYDGVPVAFIGAVLRGTPQIVSPSGVRGLEFRDEAASVNALVPELRAKGIEAIVLLIHEGGRSTTPIGAEGCADFNGAIVAIMKRLDRAVDLVVSGHTHEAYVCRVDGRLVTSAGSFGRLLTAIDLTLDRGTGDVVSAQARNHVVDPQRYAAAPAVQALVERAAAAVREVADRVVGRVEGAFTQETSPSGESNLGDLVADAQLAAMQEHGVQAAITNPGGLRAPIRSQRADGTITYGDIYTAQPFGNNVVAMRLTGEQLLRALEAQWRGPSVTAEVRILQVSGIEYSWDGSKPRGRRVVRDSIRIAGAPWVANGSYRVAMNSFLAEGGDGFTVFTQGEDRVGGPLDAEALARYIGGRTVRAAPPQGRITRVDR
jgi:5'-nucleotidase